MRLTKSLLCVALLTGWVANAKPSTRPTDVVLCHYTYGGAEKELVVRPTASPYTVEPIAVGSYFQFKVVFQKFPADLAAIKIYVYADRDPAPVPLHQASYPYPPRAQHKTGYGFTGKNWVYEPVRDGEMQYWCAMKNSQNPGHTP